MTYLRHSLAAIAVAMAAFTAQPAAAGSLENLERERAILIDTLLSAELTSQERQKRIDLSRARLIDLERMVLRDKSLSGRNTPLVRAAFDNYDLTFIVHASVEKSRAPMDHWLSEIGVSTQSLMNTTSGRR